MKYFLGLSLFFNLLYVFNLHMRTSQTGYFNKAGLLCSESSVMFIVFDIKSNAYVKCTDESSFGIDKDFKVVKI